jgi:signal transduction histidine kinase
LVEVRPHDSDGSVATSGGLATLLLLGAAGLSAFFGGYQLLETYVLIPRLDGRALKLLHIIRGITASLLLALFAAWYLVRNPTIVVQRFDRGVDAVVDHQDWKRDHLRWFIQMRWIAAGFAMGLIVIAVPLTGLLSASLLPQLLTWWAFLVGANLVFRWALRHDVDFDRQVMAQAVVDLIVLTGLLNASGGIENPLSIAYLFHVIIVGILLPKRKAIGLAVFGSAAFSFLALGELTGFLTHVTVLLFPHTHTMVGGHVHIVHAAHDVVFVAGRVVSFDAAMLLTAYFTTLVTEGLRRSEADLERSARTARLERRRLEGVIEAAGLGMAIIGSDQTLEWVNQRLASWLVWPGDAAGQPCPHDHSHPSGCFGCIAADTLARGEQTENEISVAAKNGGIRYFRNVASPVRDADGRILQVVEVVEEVTARKALESEALHSGRLSILGQLAAGIAHEIGNPLSSLHARLQLMKRRLEPDFTRESLDVLQAQIDRIGRIVRNVSHLAQNRRDGWVPIDVNTVVSEAVSLVKMDRRAASIRFAEQLGNDLPRVRGIRDQLLQVVINLLLNAVEAMPEGGTLETTTVEEAHRVKVMIRDSGVGIDEMVRTRLFEPFFTTKPEGTGLGLSICYSLVHAHGGSIEVASDPGSGSCFTVDLPVPAATDNRRRGAQA